MGKVKEIYLHNIYGVITTLVFHILVLLFLILTQLRISEQLPRDSIVLDLSLMEVKVPEPEKEKQQLQQPAASHQQKSGSSQLASNRAVNDAAKGKDNGAFSSNDPFFDKAYKNDIAAAKKLAEDLSIFNEFK